MKNPLRHAFRGSKVNRDRRDDAFCRSVIAEATRRHLNESRSPDGDGQRMSNALIQGYGENLTPQGKDQLGAEQSERVGVVIAPQGDERLHGNRLSKSADGSKPSDSHYNIGQSNARQNDYWQRVGGHPDAGEMDHDEMSFDEAVMTSEGYPDDGLDLLDDLACDHCGKLTCLGDCPQYFESLQDQMETRDDENE